MSNGIASFLKVNDSGNKVLYFFLLTRLSYNNVQLLRGCIGNFLMYVIHLALSESPLHMTVNDSITVGRPIRLRICKMVY